MTRPSKIRLRKASQTLDLAFGEQCYSLSAEYLRVMSPSAEVRGHGKGQEVLQLNKASVKIQNLEAQGNYAIKLVFDDGHDSGIYTWAYLYELATQQEQKWQDYLQKVAEHQENDGVQVIRWSNPDSP